MVHVRKKTPGKLLSDWLERVMCLPSGLASAPGPLTLHPYQRAIADAMADPAIERVSVIKSARVGYTTLLVGAIANYIVRDPAPMLVVMPTESDARGLMVDDIEGLFIESPDLRDKLPMPSPGRCDRNTLVHRIFRGGSLKVVAAGAPRNMRRHSARVLLIDEIDACQETAEGNAVALAEQRTLTWPNRKIICGGTPLEAETSNITRLYGQSDQRVWEVPCPECGAYSEIEWRAIEWPAGQPELAAWRCPHCEELITEESKPEMAAAGRWRALRPEVAGHAGFRISALASLLPNAAWPKLAAEYERAKDDPATLRVFINTVLGQPWSEDRGGDVDDAELAGRAEPFDLDHIPPEVLALTAGVDVQGDRLEATVLGHGREGATFVLGHSVLWGAPDSAEVWSDLDDLLRSRWRHPAGGSLKIDAAVIDSGGHHYDAVLAFCAARMGRRILAGKGVSGSARPAIARAKLKRGRPLFLCAVDVLKSQLFARLARGRSIRFSNTLGPEWFEQLTSERRVVRTVSGKPVARFERKPGFDAEALDCTVYALAAKAALSLSDAALAERQVALAAPDRPEKPPASTVIRSRWMERRL